MKDLSYLLYEIGKHFISLTHKIESLFTLGIRRRMQIYIFSHSTLSLLTLKAKLLNIVI